MPEQALNVTELKERFVDVSEVMQADIKKLVQFQSQISHSQFLKRFMLRILMQKFTWPPQRPRKLIPRLITSQTAT